MPQDYQVTGEYYAEDDIPAWKLLDNVVRQWAVLSGFEKDADFYEKLREISQRGRVIYQD